MFTRLCAGLLSFGTLLFGANASAPTTNLTSAPWRNQPVATSQPLNMSRNYLPYSMMAHSAAPQPEMRRHSEEPSEQAAETQTSPAPTTQTPAPAPVTPAPAAPPASQQPDENLLADTPAPWAQDQQQQAPQAQQQAPQLQQVQGITVQQLIQQLMSRYQQQQAAAPQTAQAPAPAPAPQTQAPAQQTPAAQAPAPAGNQALPAGLTAEEAQMVQLVNAERAKAGLPALEVDMRLVATARAKSQDLIAHNYFDHNSPTLGSPFDQMRAAGISYMTAGENLAGNQGVQAAHTALMNSPGHRANILSRSFKKIGVGIIHGGSYGMMFTQQFIG